MPEEIPLQYARVSIVKTMTFPRICKVTYHETLCFLFVIMYLKTCALSLVVLISFIVCNFVWQQIAKWTGFLILITEFSLPPDTTSYAVYSVAFWTWGHVSLHFHRKSFSLFSGWSFFSFFSFTASIIMASLPAICVWTFVQTSQSFLLLSQQ